MEGKAISSCFVISPIGEERSDERRHADMVLHRIIEPAFLGVVPEGKVTRSDKHSQPGSIPDSIVRHINSSDICIADLSFLNSNVFYELGICHALRKTVIHMAKEGTKLPFDNYQQYTIFFDPFDHHALLRAVARLGDAIRETTLPDFVLTNPVINALAFVSIESRNTPEEILSKNILSSLENLNNRLSNIEGIRSPSTTNPYVDDNIPIDADVLSGLIRGSIVTISNRAHLDKVLFESRLKKNAYFDDETLRKALISSELGKRMTDETYKILSESRHYIPF